MACPLCSVSPLRFCLQPGFYFSADVHNGTEWKKQISPDCFLKFSSLLCFFMPQQKLRSGIFRLRRRQRREFRSGSN
ncbi:hypothetical protein QN277_009426 [Acacia crassicarpa]|uniref:Uncharacterized protein n=1 Tax=Acacia crassicarpa TaxID=499986 RepID=A0AAE1M933_9FABA|nr:hypothetical protein QN277_009426 [Acacia crassicarpa]